MSKKIIVKGANEHNLQEIDVEIEHDSLTVITGVSGSGKSSLAFDTICKEGQRLYLETLPSYSRLYSGKLSRPDVKSISGLRATVSVNQHRSAGSYRSTVGTITELYDILRLLFARMGKYIGDEKNIKIDRSLFSFNSPKGACPDCVGTGYKEKISPELLIKDKKLSLREGALIPTTPTGYIVYSQVTVDVLNSVCKEHGFNIDIPWEDLTEENKKIIFFGSDKIKVPFGKHTLESRMKWSGITAKPRDEGYYKGLITIMEEILKRDRNKNILRFVVSEKCSSCKGERLSKAARNVFFKNKNISYFNGLSINELKIFLIDIKLKNNEIALMDPIKQAVLNRINKLETLGLDYLTLSRETSSLSGGELQRVKLATQTSGDLSGILYIFDEPSIGLHHRDNLKLISLLEDIKNRKNTVCVVEHDKKIIAEADQVIDIGPSAGINGGKVLLNDIPGHLFKYESHTASFFSKNKTISRQTSDSKTQNEWIKIYGAKKYNLKNINVSFRYNAFNIVSGVSGAGKSTLVKKTLGAYARAFFNKQKHIDDSVSRIEGLEKFSNIIEIDSTPIGRTPRSNPATYINLFDHIRDFFSQLDDAKENKLKKSHFSFNVTGGRCEECQGAGIRSVGMFFIGDVKTLCDKCHGKRFDQNILAIKFKGKSIYDILEMSFRDASYFFSDFPKIKNIVDKVNDLGLGYIKLGQPATTLSGGEAQRVKLASRLCKTVKGKTLYIFDEPTIGLSDFDIQMLLDPLSDLINGGHTIIMIEHNLDLIRSADHIVDLGPESGKNGGYCVASGTVKDIMNCRSSITGQVLKQSINLHSEKINESKSPVRENSEFIDLKGVSTNNLKNISVRIPKNKFTVVTGVSGSGKSSLAFDSLYNEAHKKFIERLSIYARQFLRSLPPSEIEETSGLTPSIGIKQNIHSNNPRSTVGTLSGIYDLYRLLYSRAGVYKDGDNSRLYSVNFSFNHNSGACPECNGLGFTISVDPSLLISNPELPFFEGALDGHETGKFYSDEFGQYKATLFKVGELNKINYSLPVKTLSKKALDIALYGTGEEAYTVNWEFKRKSRTGSFQMEQTWKGFINLINEEYSRKSMQTRGKKIRALMRYIKCVPCNGKRLNKKSLSIKFLDRNISELSELSIKNTIDIFTKKKLIIEKNPVSSILIKEILGKLNIIRDAGLDYLSLNRRIDSVSHGEYRRLQLAVQMVNGLQDMTYILDEPTQGLHPRDIKKLILLLNQLKKNNTIIAVEHDMEVISSADHIIDLGPGAGTKGGDIIASGTLNDIINNKNSKTGKFIKEKKNIIDQYRKRKLEKGFSLKNINIHNIKGLNISFPRRGITVLTGVSGSGKSSLLFKAVLRSLKRKKPIHCNSLEGNYDFAEIVEVTQSQIANTPISNPATYTGIFEQIRTCFSRSDNAVIKKLSKKHFSFNSKEGQCINCKGMGRTRISMDFLSDIWVICEECNGRRYKDEVVSCLFNGISIDQLLNKTISESEIYFENEPEIKDKLKTLIDIGLGYLKLGQGLNTLSGGEAQRLKIAKELIQSKKGKLKKLFLLDEPTTGLHFEDIKTLIALFDKLADKGHTLIIIEHDLNIIAKADWIIDMGPEGGDRGGKIIIEGRPEDIIKCNKSYTGKFLKSFLKK